MKKLILLPIATVLFSSLPVFADEEMAAGNIEGGKPVIITGEELAHNTFKAAVEGTVTPELFLNEVCGKSGKPFTVSIPNLAEGTYTVEFEFAEFSGRSKPPEPGKRVFSITRSDQAIGADDNRVIVADFDIFKEAGGEAKVFKVSSVVKHAEDSVAGPLMFNLTAKQGEAKVNVIRVKNLAGKIVSQVSARDFVAKVDPEAVKIPVVSGPELYKDPDQPMAVRVADLVRRMSLSEKADQMCSYAPAISRLRVPAYNYWNEALHGVARNKIATVFPQAIGLAAMWDEPFLHHIADAISTEGRAKKGGLTYWSPVINIFRDPRWGRGQETYGEDPFLTARLGVAFIKGMQGNDPKHLKAMACAKHFAVYNGASVGDPTTEDLYDTYLPQFEAAVREGGVMNVMSSYSNLYGEACSSSHFLLTDILRTKWGFKGHVVSDNGAVAGVQVPNNKLATPDEKAARAVLAGCDLACGNNFKPLPKAVAKRLITEAQIDVALKRVLEARFLLGMFDPPERVPFTSISASKIDCPEHQDMALHAAEESIVLLKNDRFLPLDKSKLKRIAVIGPNAENIPMLHASYCGSASHPVSLLAGIKAAAADAEVIYEKGVPLAQLKGAPDVAGTPEFQKAVEIARMVDLVIYVGGISGNDGAGGMEGEGSSRTMIELPPCQTTMLKALHETKTPVVFVNCSGSAIAMPWEVDHLPAIVQAWYPGQAGGTAVANILFGAVNPAGRLPVTFYRATGDMPPFNEISMANRTYRYFTGKPLFPFGHGLSYTTFTYGKIKRNQETVKANDTLSLSIPVTNTGVRDGDEVVQVYYRPLDRQGSKLIKALCGFKRVPIAAGKTVNVTMEIPASRFRCWDDTKKDYVVPTGKYEIEAGASSADIRQTQSVTVQ